jgi:6-phospho-3-hexuloisomerase
MNLQTCAENIIHEIKTALSGLSEKEIAKLVDIAAASPRIFLAGAGRSGLMIRSFAMRLMHLGFTAYVVGETTTPGITPDDLLLIGSGSGATESLVVMAEKAKLIGAKVALITILKESPLGNLADPVITVAAPTPKIKDDPGFRSIQPMGTLFEQSLLLTLDMIILFLMAARHQDAHMMFQNHANLE